MRESGFYTEKQIKDGMESRMKKAQGVSSVGDLNQRYLTPEGQELYDSLMNQLALSDAWKRATEKQRDSVTDKVYSLSAGTNEGQKLQEKIDGGSAFGLDATDYILFQIALAVEDLPTQSGKYGSYTNEEVEKAIRAVPDLSSTERDYLWISQGKSGKSVPKW